VEARARRVDGANADAPATKSARARATHCGGEGRQQQVSGASVCESGKSTRENALRGAALHASSPAVPHTPRFAPPFADRTFMMVGTNPSCTSRRDAMRW
jgi:hypothetical protein